jgi:hypothetical protein
MKVNLQNASDVALVVQETLSCVRCCFGRSSERIVLAKTVAA